MKKAMKKTMLKFQVLAILITFIFPCNVSYAESWHSSTYGKVDGNYPEYKMAEELYELGLFHGKSSETYAPFLMHQTTSQEAITLIGRALGWRVDSNAKSSFEDLSQWAVPYAEYAKEKGITAGVGNGSFGSQIDGKRMLTWTLAALGEDKEDVWNNTEKYAGKYNIEIPETSYRKDVVYVIYETMKHAKVGENISLIDKVKKDFANKNVKTLPDLPKGFTFSSGVGAWGTYIEVKPDLSFEGVFRDSNAGESGPGYFSTVYVSKFKGQFENLRQVNKFEYQMDLKYIEVEGGPKEEIVENVRKVRAEPYGLEEGKTFSYYLPGKLKNKLPKAFIEWGYELPDLLNQYGIYNIEKGYGFYSSGEDD